MFFNWYRCYYERMTGNFFYRKLTRIVSPQNILRDEPMALHTTFRIGGPADYLVSPESAEELAAVRKLCAEEGVASYIVGNGSNLLVADQGYRGVIIRVLKNMDRIEIENDTITAQAGALLSSIASKALSASLAGFAFASGIPGTIGGACVMNAGAYGGELQDVLVKAEVLTPEGERKEFTPRELEMGYRTSIIPKKGYLVTKAVLKLQHGNANEIRETMEELREKRIAKQPLNFPSAGSTFKRPEGYFAGKLIEDAGLKGYRVGDAQVSEKHSGFVVNRGQATAKDVRQLIRDVSDKVFAESGVRLVPEVKFLGNF